MRLCSETKPNFPGWVEAPTTTTPLGLNSDSKNRPVVFDGCKSFDGVSASLTTRASTATIEPSLLIKIGLMSIDEILGSLSAASESPTRRFANCSLETADSPRNPSSIFLCCNRSCNARAPCLESGTGANATSASTSV